MYNERLAKEWESRLIDMISEEFEDADTETFDQAGLLTRDLGVVVYLDGQEIRLTIQAFER